MAKNIVFRILAGLVLLAALAGIAFFAYNAGVAHGATLDVKALIPQTDGQPLTPHAYHFTYMHTFPFFGFGCFGLLIPFFLLMLAFAAFRHLLWGPHWGWRQRMRMHLHEHGHGPWGEKGPWDGEIPPMVAEWHRRMHENPTSEDSNKK